MKYTKGQRVVAKTKDRFKGCFGTVYHEDKEGWVYVRIDGNLHILPFGKDELAPIEEEQ